MSYRWVICSAIRVLADVPVRFRAGFAYVDATTTGGHTMPLCRLRFTGVLHTWGFAIYLASRDGYQDSVLPSGLPAGSPEEASTAPAASTSTTPPPGSHPRRTNAMLH